MSEELRTRVQIDIGGKSTETEGTLLPPVGTEFVHREDRHVYKVLEHQWTLVNDTSLELAYFSVRVLTERIR